MCKITKRIRIHEEVDFFMSKNKIKKQQFIEAAITEKLERDFKYRIKVPF